MARFFNHAGPSDPDKHYSINPLQRLNLPELTSLIEQERYFILHAPRQTGKTSCLLALMAHLNASGRYRCVYVNVEIAQTARNDVAAGIGAILWELAELASFYLDDEFPRAWVQSTLKQVSEHEALALLLRQWASHSPLPLIVLIDEIDALVGDTLVSVLRQLRAGYTQRPRAFPQSVVLCGVRDVRDYRIQTSSQEIITGGSAFNIKAESLRLGNFSHAEMVALLAQYTAETGHGFADGVMDLMWELTHGQPWLVNALARQALEKTPVDRSVPLSTEQLLAAKNALVLERATHLDQLAFRLREDRVKRIIQPILAGATKAEDFREDDVQYLEDLGLIRRGNPREGEQGLLIANGIYQEIIPRELISTVEYTFNPQPYPWYCRPDGRLDMAKLITDFQDFFRRHSEHWVERFDYKEAGPQLLLQAFLQRVINGGGRIDREYGLGRQRTDLFVVWFHGEHAPDPLRARQQRIVLELKLIHPHDGPDTVLAQGLEQTARYAERCRADESHLLLFDRRPGISWDEKIRHGTQSHRGSTIEVWGL
jgi:hypothetical protein